MNCFRHRKIPAIGIRRSCGKGLCEECVAEVPNGIACKNSCESRVVFINQMLDSNQRVMVVSNSSIRSHAVLTLAMGLIFLGCAIWAYFAEISLLAGFLGIFSLVLLIYGISRLRARLYPAQYSKAE